MEIKLYTQEHLRDMIKSAPRGTQSQIAKYSGRTKQHISKFVLGENVGYELHRKMNDFFNENEKS